MNDLANTAGVPQAWDSELFALVLGTGKTGDVTLLHDFEGGNIYADVISEINAGEHRARKHLGPPRYEPFEVRFGAPMGWTLFDWIAGSWGAQPEKRNGAVLSLDSSFNIKREVAFSGALITDLTFPEFDSSSNETGYLTLRFQPELIKSSEGVGRVPLSRVNQKLWRAANFRLQVEGLDCTRVSAINPVTVKREVAEASSGGGNQLTAGKVEIPNLVVTLSLATASTWYDWHESFVVNGKNGAEFERSGSLSILSYDFKQELSRIDLHHLGIVRLAHQRGEAGEIARVVAELYCEEIVLSQPKGKL